MVSTSAKIYATGRRVTDAIGVMSRQFRVMSAECL